MALLSLLAWVGAATVLLVGLSLELIVGRRRVWEFHEQLFDNLRKLAPYVGFLLIILGITSVARDIGPDISWIVGFRLDVAIYAFEGKFVEWIQSYATPVATQYFSLVYIYGYIYILVFPFVAYAMLDDLRSFRILTLAYVLNYVIGLACYVFFIAYGPRNFLVGESLLYTTWSQAQMLTSEVNHNTNVFPSLHASLSLTVAFLSLRTRTEYKRWPLVAIPLALSVSFATMYLGIHWATDVVAGAVLAVLSIKGADLLHDRFEARIERSRKLWGSLIGQTEAASS